MNHVFQKIDNSLSVALKGFMNVSEIEWGKERQDFINACTVNKDLYEDMYVYEFTDAHHFNEFTRLLSHVSDEVAKEYAAKHGKILSREVSKKFELMLMLSAIGNLEYSQMVADEVYTCIMKHDLSEFIDGFAKKVYLREKAKEIARKPRNKYHEQAIKIAKATWQAFPGASMGKLCEKLRNHFNGGVSLDTLERWIKAAKIRPPKPEKYTSFSLVIPPSA